MSEENKKPERKRRVLRWFMLLTVVLIIIVVCFFLSVLGSGWHEAPQKPYAYNTEHDEIQNAVAGYAIDHDEALPILNGTYTTADCSNCSVINISALLIANGGLLREVPHSCNLSTSGNDNCGGNTSLGCNNYGSYIWLVDVDGKVFSYCAGVGCETNNSGYQDVWP